MKKLIFTNLLLILTGMLCTTEAQDTACNKRMDDAHQYLEGISRPYNPEKAFGLWMECALAGVPKAMNAIGVMYNKGTGVAVNHAEALKWFEKASSAGYAQSWCSLGLMYKNAQGVKLDYSKAYECFKKAAELGNHAGLYSEGYMLYKGLGCTQDYDEAFKLFTKAYRSKGAMYMLGLCYRNGYGTERDTVKANYWLSKLARGGFKAAIDEMSEGSPENSIAQSQLKSSRGGEPETPDTYTKVGHFFPKNEIEGNYKGYLVMYDWSGKTIVQESTLKLKLTVSHNVVRGIWQEGDSTIANIEALLSDTKLEFTSLNYKRWNHYHQKNQLLWQFKEANIEVIKKDTEIYLAGNLHCFLPELMEPAKPMYITLVKEKVAEDTKNMPVQPDGSKGSIFSAVVYPNPFSSELHTIITITDAAQVKIKVFDMNGKQVHETDLGVLPSGIQTKIISLSLPAGVYIVKAISGSEVITSVVVKQ